MQEEEQKPKSLWVSDVRTWQIGCIILGVLLVVILLVRKQIVITKEWLVIFAIGGAVFLIYTWLQKQKENLSFMQIAEKIADEYYTYTGVELDTTQIKGLPLSDDTYLIEFIRNSCVFQYNMTKGIIARDIDTLFGARKDLENSLMARKFFERIASEEQMKKKLEDLGLQV
jgi:hypothetical protein